MPADTRVKKVYASDSEWKALDELCEKTGKARGHLLFRALKNDIRANPKEYDEMGEKLANAVERKEILQIETRTGAYLGGKEKLKEKHKFIDENEKDPVVRELLHKIADRNYSRTQEIDREEIMAVAEKEGIGGYRNNDKSEKLGCLPRCPHTITLAEMNANIKALRMKKYQLDAGQYEIIFSHMKDGGFASFPEAYKDLMNIGDQ
jgi:hypothetical protein